MSISSQSTRDYNKSISSALNSIVKVILEIDYPTHYYVGRLVGFDNTSQGLVLEEARDDKHNKYDHIFIHGAKWISFTLEGEPFPIEALAKRLRSVLPSGSVELMQDNTISCLGGKVKVSEGGVKGKGPTFERIQKIYLSFIAELNASQ